MTKTEQIAFPYTGHTIEGLAQAIATHRLVDARTGVDDSWNDKLVSKMEKLDLVKGQHITYMKTSSMAGKSMTRFMIQPKDNESVASMLLHDTDPFEEVKQDDKKSRPTTTYSF